MASYHFESALGIRVRAGVIVILAVVCQVFAPALALSGPFNWFVRIGVPFLALLISTRKKATLSEGTKNIVKAMEKLGVKRFICESSLGVGDSEGQLGFLYNYILIPLLLRNIFADKEVQESAGRHFVDSAQRGSLAGFARGVPVAGDLLAAAEGLGGARGLARDLAGVSSRVE